MRKIKQLIFFISKRAKMGKTDAVCLISKDEIAYLESEGFVVNPFVKHCGKTFSFVSWDHFSSDQSVDKNSLSYHFYLISNGK